MTAKHTPRASHTGGPGGWIGAIRIGRAIVWECGEMHQNRDKNGYFAGESAHSCACRCLEYALTPERAAVNRDWLTRYGRSADDVRYGLARIEFAERQAEAIRAAIAKARGEA